MIRGTNSSTPTVVQTTASPLFETEAVFDTESDELQAFKLDEKRFPPSLDTLSGTVSVNHQSSAWARAMWRKALFKVKAENALRRINAEIVTYGTDELVQASLMKNFSLKQILSRNDEKAIKYRTLLGNEDPPVKVPSCLLHPDSSFKRRWDSILILFILYTATVMPILIAFSDTVFWDAWTVFDLVVDVVFFCDVFISFNSGLIREDGTLEANRRVIACKYLKTWFCIDVSACVPFNLIDLFWHSQETSTTTYNNLLRIGRLPRLYKLLRLTRIVKALKYSNNELIYRLQDFLHMNSRTLSSGLTKLLKFLVMVSVCVHLMGCLWFFSYKIDAGNVDSWVVRYDYEDSYPAVQYLCAAYWTLMTVVTLGYGDIVAKTELEIELAILWMIIGVGFYSYTVGSLSSFLISIDTRDSILSMKLAAVHELANESGINNHIKIKIKNQIRYQTWNAGFVCDKKQTLFSELPKDLQYEVAVSMYGGVLRRIPFFAKRNKHFFVYFIPILKPLRLENAEELYHEGDNADLVYFILKGRVNLVLSYKEIVYKSYVRSSYLGDIEVIRRIPRIDNAIGFGDCEFLSVQKVDFLEMLKEFPGEGKEIKAVANERFRRHKQAMVETYELIKMRMHKGSLRVLAGHARLLNLMEEMEDEPSFKQTEVSHRMDTMDQGLKEMKEVVGGLNDSLGNIRRDLHRLTRN